MKIYIYVTPKCANYIGAHTANYFQCTLRHKTDIKAKQGINVIGKEGKKKLKLRR